MSPGVAIVRADICAACPTPCAPRPDVLDPCAACPIHRWSMHDCGTPAPAALPGDILAARIERHVPTLAAAAAHCGGCTQARHALGSTSRHPDPGVVI